MKKMIALALVGLGMGICVLPADAQIVTYYSPVTTAYYAPADTGSCCGTTAYYAPVTAYYAPAVTAYYAPVTTYYAPAVTTAYYAPAYYAPTVAYYAPVAVYRPYRARAFYRGRY